LPESSAGIDLCHYSATSPIDLWCRATGAGKRIVGSDQATTRTAAFRVLKLDFTRSLPICGRISHEALEDELRKGDVGRGGHAGLDGHWAVDRDECGAA